ncbi:hypothetical protein [Acetanaerobacterium elongatum]|uniref:Uncharacterized protein n=1 Tax=Acetanaerobacterium elongatum TaxID=258515 RepID=A0A1G9YZN4_9FIRM|nr:hypothetical protein [Acetanaerobacterium elongatum]SDN14185.1 hypothetical protein SAMN05192585_11228 [Acetanaerobacterium elongatum]
MSKKPDFEAYLKRIFAGGKRKLTSADLPLENDDDFVCSIMLSMCDECEVQPLEGSISKNGYTIANLVIRRCS